MSYIVEDYDFPHKFCSLLISDCIFSMMVESLTNLRCPLLLRPLSVIVYLHAKYWCYILEKRYQENLGGDLSVAMHPHFRKGPFLHVINWFLFKEYGQKIRYFKMEFSIVGQSWQILSKWTSLSQNPSDLLIFMGSSGTGVDSFISDHLLKVFKRVNAL